MHKLGCPKRNNLYADCDCVAMEQREHTEQLRQYNENVRVLISAGIVAHPSGISSYSAHVDPHIYGIAGGCQTPQQWIELAMAALDQAGLSERDRLYFQDQMEKRLL